MSIGTSYSVTEQELFRVTELSDGDLIRLVSSGASRNVLYSALVNDLSTRLANLNANLQSFQIVTAGIVTITSTSPQVTLCDTTAGQVTVILPPAASSVEGSAGRVFTVKKITTGANNVLVQTQASETIDNDTDALLVGSEYPAISVISDAQNWWLVNA